MILGNGQLAVPADRGTFSSVLDRPGRFSEVVQLDGVRVTARDARDRWRAVGLTAFLARAAPMAAADGLAAVGAGLAALSDAERHELSERAGLRELPPATAPDLLTPTAPDLLTRRGRRSRVPNTTRPRRCVPTRPAGRYRWAAGGHVFR
ncbi:hypothetical protein FAIPA1_600021 [Frankia sp. AiPs1]